MKHLTILVPNGENNLSSMVGSYKLFSRANHLWKAKHGRAMFTVELVGLSKKVHFYDELFSVQPHKLLKEVKKTNLVIIPSLNHQYEKAIQQNGPMIEWINDQYQQGAAVASICTGAFLLAASGLLEGKTCSTHWSAANTFRQKFPGINLQADRLITDEHSIYTNGGAYSFLHLLIYLIEKYYDRTTAIACSKIFQIDMDRQTQSVFAIFSGQKSHGDEVVVKAQQYLEKNANEKISMEQLAGLFCVGRRNFDRRFIKATGNTPLEYLQRVKIESAKKELEMGDKTVTEVMYEVGYADAKAFREVFRRITGYSPLEYRGRFART